MRDYDNAHRARRAERDDPGADPAGRAAPRRPPLPTLIHLSFDLMVGLGFLLLALAAWQGWWWWFHRLLLLSPWFLVPTALSGVAAVVAMEAGWTVTEVGRQPWIVYRIMLTGSAVTPASGVVVTLVVILVLYAIMTVVSIGVPMSPMAATCWGVRGCSLSVELPGAAAGYRTAPSQRAARRSGPGLGNPPPIQIGIRGCGTGRGRQMISLTWKCVPW